MSRDKPKDLLNEIDVRLNGVFGELGRALTEALGKLEEGGGEVRRTQTFQSAKGPMRAEAGIKLRVGGMEIGGAPPPSSSAETHASREESGPPTRDIEATIFSDATNWSLTAELPGVSKKDVHLSLVGADLSIAATGAGRAYAGAFALPEGLGIEDISISLRNGILDLTAKLPQGENT